VGLPSRRACPSSVQPHRPRWLSLPAKMVVAQQQPVNQTHQTFSTAPRRVFLPSSGRRRRSTRLTRGPSRPRRTRSDRRHCPQRHSWRAVAPFYPRNRPYPYDKEDQKAAWGAVFPTIGLWRCGATTCRSSAVVHKHRNLPAHAPKHMHEEPSNHYRDMIYADTAAEVETRRKVSSGKPSPDQSIAVRPAPKASTATYPHRKSSQAGHSGASSHRSSGFSRSWLSSQPKPVRDHR